MKSPLRLILLLHDNLFVLFTFLVWYKYSTQEIIRNDFLCYLEKKNLEADVCGVISGLDLRIWVGRPCVWGEAMDPQRGHTLSHGP
jgi:hypothetical protein